MIEILIISAAIALVFMMGAIALVLMAEIKKQKRPSRFRFRPTHQQQQLTPEQLKMVESLRWIGIPGGIVLSVLVRTGALSILDASLITLALAVAVGGVTWLAIRHSSSDPIAPSPNSSPKISPPTELQRQLIRMCGGDRGQAERLAALERGDWQAAIDRLIRDRL